MPKGPPLPCKLRTGVLFHPSSSKARSENTLNNNSGCGTWNTLKFTKKNPLKVSGVLKEEQLLAMMDSLITGTGLTSDLNTPDIKFEDFDFKDKAVSSYNVSNMDVAFEPAVSVVCNSDEDSLTTSDAANSGDCYTLFDMSPGSRDLLQADQQEQRVSIQEYVGEGDDDNSVVAYKSCILSNTIMPELDCGLLLEQQQPQTACETLLGNGLGATALGQAQMMVLPGPYVDNTPPELSITDDDLLNFPLPQDVLEQMESLFPEERPIIENPVQANNSNASSTELDMYLGTHGMDGDLLTESLQISGLLDHELEAFNFEDDERELFTINTESFVLPSNVLFSQEPKAIVQLVNPLPLPLPFKPIVKEPSPCFNVEPQSLLVTPTSSKSTGAFETLLVKPTTTSQTIGTYPKTPSKKRQCQWGEVTLSLVSTSGAKRQRRAAKKPLRFREPEAIVEFIDSESNESAPGAEAAERVGFASIGKAVVEEEVVNIKDEDEHDIQDDEQHSASRKRGRNSLQKLTEEQKYHRIRILNNEASKRCRQKRKSTVKEMDVELVELTESNEKLKKKHQDLKQLKDKFQSFVNDYFRKRLLSNH